MPYVYLDGVQAGRAYPIRDNMEIVATMTWGSLTRPLDVKYVVTRGKCEHWNGKLVQTHGKHSKGMHPAGTSSMTHMRGRRSGRQWEGFQFGDERGTCSIDFAGWGTTQVQVPRSGCLSTSAMQSFVRPPVFGLLVPGMRQGGRQRVPRRYRRPRAAGR